jgi:hypothetical protein
LVEPWWKDGLLSRRRKHAPIVVSAYQTHPDEDFDQVRPAG